MHRLFGKQIINYAVIILLIFTLISVSFILHSYAKSKFIDNIDEAEYKKGYHQGFFDGKVDGQNNNTYHPHIEINTDRSFYSGYTHGYEQGYNYRGVNNVDRQNIFDGGDDLIIKGKSFNSNR